MAAFIARARQRLAAVVPAKSATLFVVATLLVLPILFPLAGFVLSSTLLFAVVAQTLGSSGRQNPRHGLAFSVVLGFVFSTVLYLIFSRGLGVILPPTPGLGGFL